MLQAAELRVAVFWRGEADAPPRTVRRRDQLAEGLEDRIELLVVIAEPGQRLDESVDEPSAMLATVPIGPAHMTCGRSVPAPGEAATAFRTPSAAMIPGQQFR